MENSYILMLLLLLHLGKCTANRGDLSAYLVSSFQSEHDKSNFNNFAVNKNNGDVYIGATNHIYHVKSNFALQKSVPTNQCGDRCSNHNRILVIDYEAHKIITCGSEIDGRCQMRNWNDIAASLENGNIVAPSALLSVNAIIARGPYGQNMLYIGATYDPTRYGIGKVTPLARRSIRSYGDALLASDAEIFFTSSVINTKPFMINYMDSFDWNRFTHFVTMQRLDYNPLPFGDSGFHSKINRVCQGSKSFDSFTELVLECRGQNDVYYNLVQSVHIGKPGLYLAESLNITEHDSVLFGVFARSIDAFSYEASNSSALCIFKMADIEEAFSEAVYGCLRNGSDFQLQYLKNSDCPGFEAITPETAAQMECNAFCYSYSKALRPVTSQALFNHTGLLMTSINVKTERNHTIAFAGTQNGDIMKIQVDNIYKARLYETLHLRSPVLRQLEFAENQEYIFVSTERELLKLKTSNCSYYRTSEECIGINGEDDGDPHCGWCTEQIRCTRYDECSVSSGSAPWLPYSQQCREVTDVQPSSHLPVTATEQTITLTIDLDIDQYEYYAFFCSFDDMFESPATKLLNQFTCRTPPSTKVPQIEAGDSITIPLYIRSIPALVDCVKTDFSFYDCSLHSSCTSCVKSDWGCDWCILDNRCTHKSTGCENQYKAVSNINKESTIHSQANGPEGCPQLEKQPAEILVPSGAARQIEIPAKGLPSEHEVFKWECVLTIEGMEYRTAAVHDNSVIMCLKTQYTYKEAKQEINVTAAVFWNDEHRLDDIHGFQVTLYKCDIDRSDCSRCLSTETTRRELNCGWCPQYSVCIIEEDTLCDNSWISPRSRTNCPNPVIEKVWPPSGPIEGNTVIELTGTNLGRQFSDIQSVTVCGWNCDLNGLQEFYKTGESVSCQVQETSRPSEGPIMLNLYGVDNTLQVSNGDVQYKYQIPEIVDFTPQIGPQAGGTEIQIIGNNLNTGRLITAEIGDSKCYVDRANVNDSVAMCRTSDSLSGNSHPIVMKFDGVSKTSQAAFSYQLNPSINDVTPLMSIQAGGRKLIVRGDRLDTIRKPIIFVVLPTGELSTAICSVNDSSLMECPSPTINNNISSINKRDIEDQIDQIASDVVESIEDLIRVIEGTTKRRAFVQEGQGSNAFEVGSGKDGEVNVPIGFIMDGVQDLLRWSDFSQVALKYLPNPVYKKFDNQRSTLSGRVLQLSGKHLNLASRKEDVEVFIGGSTCEVTVLVEDLLTCTAPDKQPPGFNDDGETDHGILPWVKVKHGNLVQYIGQLKYDKTTIPTWVKVFLGIFFPGAIIIIVGVLIFVAWWYRKTRTEYEMVQNREEELLDQIRSLKSALSVHKDNQKGRPLSHVTLSNNVRIDQKDVSLNYDQLLFKQELGKGAFGKVFQATLDLPDKQFTRTVAVKTVKDDADPGTTLKFLEEGLLMKKFVHPNIMALIGLTFDPQDNPAIVLPLMLNGDLKTYLRSENTVVNGRQLVNFALDVAYGMVYLANMKFVHRDLAARNCMVSESLIVKVADFGLSRDVKDTDIYKMKETKKLPVKWMAIECLDRKIFTTESDVWSYGVLFWEIFTRGELPYTKVENRDLYYRLVEGHRLECPEYCPKQIYDVMYECWKDDPEDRPSFPDIVSKLTCILDSNDPGDKGKVDEDVPEPPKEDATASEHHNPTYLEPMDMMPAEPPPAPPNYVNDERNDEDMNGETAC